MGKRCGWELWGPICVVSVAIVACGHASDDPHEGAENDTSSTNDGTLEGSDTSSTTSTGTDATSGATSDAGGATSSENATSSSSNGDAGSTTTVGENGGSGGDSQAGSGGGSQAGSGGEGDLGDYASCTNGEMDGDETDIDCGGPLCRRCADGAACQIDADCVSLACLAAACGEREITIGEVGSRCSSEGDCQVGLECVTEFFGERAICTMNCATADCPSGSECVSGIPSYLSSDLPEPYCLVPCVMSPDCDAWGTECDSHDSLQPARYCF